MPTISTPNWLRLSARELLRFNKKGGVAPSFRDHTVINNNKNYETEFGKVCAVNKGDRQPL